MTSILADRIGLTVPMLITSAVFEHEARCHGGCDTSQAHAQGDPAVRAATDEAWNALQTELARRYIAGRRN